MNQQIDNDLNATAAEIAQLHDEVLNAARTSIGKMIRIGELLIKAKASMPHGNYLPWLETNVPFSRWTAQRYIRLYEHKDSLKWCTVHHLSDGYIVIANLLAGEKDDAANQLTLPIGVELTKNKLVEPAYHDLEDWKQTTRFLFKSDDAMEFWRVNHVEAGRKKFGDEVLRDALTEIGVDASTLKPVLKLGSLLAQVDVSEPDLSLDHHCVLAKAKMDKTGQRMWAELAVKHELSAAELHESIKKGVVTRIESMRAGHATRGLATFEGIRQQWEILQRQIAPGLAGWTEEEARTALELLAPIVDFVAEVRARFGLELER